jgi:hypothetical protein
MAGRLRSRPDRSSALIAGTLAVGLFAGVAIANPAAFDRSIDKAVSIFRSVDPGRPNDAPGGRDNRGPDTHTPEDCASLVAGFHLDPDDTKGLEHAIEVVEANCEKNAKAKGLLNALQHLLANAEKHALHESNAGGNGKGHGLHGHENAHANGQANGHATGHGNGQGGGQGS